MIMNMFVHNVDDPKKTLLPWPVLGLSGIAHKLESLT